MRNFLNFLECVLILGPINGWRYWFQPKTKNQDWLLDWAKICDRKAVQLELKQENSETFRQAAATFRQNHEYFSISN